MTYGQNSAWIQLHMWRSSPFLCQEVWLLWPAFPSVCGAAAWWCGTNVPFTLKQSAYLLKCIMTHYMCVFSITYIWITPRTKGCILSWGWGQPGPPILKLTPLSLITRNIRCVCLRTERVSEWPLVWLRFGLLTVDIGPALDYDAFVHEHHEYSSQAEGWDNRNFLCLRQDITME